MKLPIINYSLQIVEKILVDPIEVDFENIKQIRQAFVEFISTTQHPIYGFNQLLGEKNNAPITDISEYENIHLEQLLCNQILEMENIQKIDQKLSRITLFVLINNLVQNSGISEESLIELIDLFNSKSNIDLFYGGYNNQYYDGSINYKISKQIKSLQKYDIIIITQMKSLSFATLLYYTYQAKKCISSTILTTGVSFEASNGVICAFTELVNQVKQHEGQLEIAQQLFELLTEHNTESSLNLSLKDITNNILQDAYSTRCIPQVIGASLDQIKMIINQIESINEMKGYKLIIQDNKISNIIHTEQNNNDQELMLLDFLAISVSEIGAISERRIQRIMNPQLTKLQEFYNQYLRDIESPYGFQALANLASNLIQKNKKYCHPVSCDSMPQTTYMEDINNNFEDSIQKMEIITTNTIKILAIDLFISSKIVNILEKTQQEFTNNKINKIVIDVLKLSNLKQIIEYLSL